MVVKIFKENPLSYGLYKTLPEELKNTPGIIYETTKEEELLLKTHKKFKLENNRLIVDYIKEKEGKDRQQRDWIKKRNRSILERKINLIKQWFNEYDQAIIQFNRKQMLYQNKTITDEQFNLEKEKIDKLNKEAEIKAKELKELQTQLKAI